jgi:CRISPR-associated protein Csx10
MPEVEVTLHQPAALGRRPSGGTAVDTYRHIPGSVLRGALAAAWIRKHGVPASAEARLREQFVTLFERGVRFGPLLAPGWDVVPLSVLRCKYRPYLECRNTLTDSAQEPEPSDSAAASVNCTVCQGPLTVGRGEVEPVNAPLQGDDSAGSATVRTTRVKLTDRETAADGMLFTRTALSHRTSDGRARTLTGRIVGGGPWLMGTHRIQLGGRRSTGGDASCRIEPDTTTHQNAGPALTLLEGYRLVLRLTSPAIFVDDYGRATDQPDRAHLQHLLGIEVPAPARSWTRRELTGGWHAATRLPKPDDYAASAGCVYEYHLREDPGSQALARLVDHGVGLRRPEGFGWIALGAWAPPPAPDPTEGPGTGDQRPRILEEVLAEFITTGLLRELQNRAAALGRNEPGAELDRSLLNLPRVRELPLQRQRAFARALELDARALADLCRRLDQRMRGVR